MCDDIFQLDEDLLITQTRPSPSGARSGSISRQTSHEDLPPSRSASTNSDAPEPSDGEELSGSVKINEGVTMPPLDIEIGDPTAYDLMAVELLPHLLSTMVVGQRRYLSARISANEEIMSLIKHQAHDREYQQTSLGLYNDQYLLLQHDRRGWFLLLL